MIFIFYFLCDYRCDCVCGCVDVVLSVNVMEVDGRNMSNVCVFNRS